MITVRLLTFTVEGKEYRESMREEIARANARAIVSVSERCLQSLSLVFNRLRKQVYTVRHGRKPMYGRDMILFLSCHRDDILLHKENIQDSLYMIQDTVMVYVLCHGQDSCHIQDSFYGIGYYYIGFLPQGTEYHLLRSWVLLVRYATKCGWLRPRLFSFIRRYKRVDTGEDKKNHLL